MNGESHPHDHGPITPDTPVDSGSHALAEALRSSFTIIRIVMALLFLLFLFSGFFKVEQQEQAIILRFGKPVGEGEKALLGAGLHWAFPRPIDEVVKVPITSIQKVTSTVGWYAMTPEQELSGVEPPAGPSLNPAIDGYLLTADGNIVHSRATLQYRIEDPVRCVFDFAGETNMTFNLTGVSNAVLNVLNNALLYSAAGFKVDDLLYRDVAGFKEAVVRRTKSLIDHQKLGVVVDDCQVVSRPPRQLKEAFDAVVNAEVNRSKVLYDARSTANQITNQASATAAARVNSAEVERTNRVASLIAEADMFKGLLPKYESNPDLFMQARLLQTMGRVLTNARDKIYLPTTADGKSTELRLLLNRELPKSSNGTSASP